MAGIAIDRVRRHLASYGEWWWAPVFYALVVAWIYRGLWHHGAAATGLGWDTIDTHGPDLDFFSRELAEGRFSLWNPYDKGGYPVFCDPVFDRYYPLNWPFATWGALAGTSWWLVQMKVMAHHVVAGCAMHLFLRTRGVSVRGALVGGIGLVASAPLLVHKASNILWPLVWVPLVWVAIDAALAKPSWRRGAALAGAVLLPMTAGSPPGLFYALLLILPYGALRLVTTLRDPARRTRAALIELAICAATAAVLAGLVLAVTVLPTSDLVALGSRDRFATGPSFALELSLPLPAAARGVFARGTGLFEVYCGATIALLAVMAVALRPRFDRGAAIEMVAMAVMGVVLAAGTTALVLPWLVTHAPGFGLLRIPGRYKLLCAWSLAAAAGYGVAALETTVSRRRVLAVAGGAFAIVIACVAARGMPAGPKDHPAWWAIVATLVPAALVAAAVFVPRRWLGAPLGALAVCALIDAPLFTFVEPGAPVAAEIRQTHPHDDEIVARLDGARDRWRVYDEFVLGERAGARLRIRDFRGYPALDPISLHRYIDVLDFAKQEPRIVTDYNVRWVLSRPHWRYGNAVQFVHVPAPGFVDRGTFLWEAEHPAPLVQWVGAVDIVADPDPQHVLAQVRALEDPDGARRRAVVEPRDALWLPPLPGPADAREGTLESYAPNAIRVAVDAPRAGLVVVNEIMFPGWHVTVDGEPAAPIRANYLLRGVWVPAGHHEIAWRFEPAHWRLLVAGYVSVWLALIAAAFATVRRRRRALRATADP